MLPILPLIAVVGNAAVIGAAHGALSGAAFGAVIKLVVGAHNRRPMEDVVTDALHGAAQGALSGAVIGGAIGAVGATVHIATSARHAHNFQHLEKAVKGKKYLYTIDDPATNLTKIGVTDNPARRLAEVSRDVGSNVQYTSVVTPMDNAFKAEAALHGHFSGVNVPHPSHATGSEWFSGVGSHDVAGELIKTTVSEQGIGGGLMGSAARQATDRNRRRRRRSAREAAGGRGRKRRHRRRRRQGASQQRSAQSRRCGSRSERPARA